MTSPVEVWNEWSWRHQSWHFNALLWCPSRAGEVGITCTQPSPPQGIWPLAQLSHRHTNRSPFTYSCCSWPKAGEKTTGKVNMGIKGNKREFLHEPMGIPHTVFHSPQNTPSSCLIKWHLVSIFAWLFSSLHHWEESNLSNWYREFFPAWLKEQTLYWDSFMAVAVISFRNHGKGT